MTAPRVVRRYPWSLLYTAFILFAAILTGIIR